MEEETEEQEEDIWIKLLVLPHSLNNIEITIYFTCEPRFNSNFSRNNLPRIKDGAYVTNLDDKKSKGRHLVLLFIDRYTTAYFDSVGIEYVPLAEANIGGGGMG